MAGRVNNRPVAVVTGANRGLDLETCRALASRSFQVVLTARRKEAAHDAAERLGAEPMQLDVTDAKIIERAAAELRDRYGRLDVLVNNVAISTDISCPRTTVFTASRPTVSSPRVATSTRLLPVAKGRMKSTRTSPTSSSTT